MKCVFLRRLAAATLSIFDVATYFVATRDTGSIMPDPGGGVTLLYAGPQCK